MRIFLSAAESEPHPHYKLVAVGKGINGAQEQTFFVLRLYAAIYRIRFTAENIGQKQLVPVPIHVQRLIERNLVSYIICLSQEHEYLVFDAPRGICRELYVL